MYFRGVQDQESIYKKWAPLLEDGTIADDTLRMSTAIVLENAQQFADYQGKKNGRSLITEAADITAGAGGVFGSLGSPNQDTASQNDTRIPSIVIPMIRRVYPQLIAHKLVGVQPMQGPIGMAFAFRAKYGKKGSGGGGTNMGLPTDPITGGQTATFDANGNVISQNLQPGQRNPAYDANGAYQTTPTGQEIGYNNVNAGFSGAAGSGPLGTNNDAYAEFFIGKSPDFEGPFGQRTYGAWGAGAELGDSENWAIGDTMPGAGFEILRATVTAKTRKLGVQLTRETEEDMRAMQGLNAQQEISDLLSYEIAQEIDRQLLGEIVKSAITAGNCSTWDPALADGRHQVERVNALYTTLLNRSSEIAVKNRRGAANFCVGSPTATALLESQIYNPLSVGGGMGNGKAFGKDVDNGLGVTEVGALRNGTIKLFRDTLAGGDYILLGFKGNNVYDAGVIYLPYIPLELISATDPFTMNPTIATRTRYGVTTNLFGAGQFYHFIGLKGIRTPAMNANKERVFIQ